MHELNSLLLSCCWEDNKGILLVDHRSQALYSSKLFSHAMSQVGSFISCLQSHGCHGGIGVKENKEKSGKFCHLILSSKSGTQRHCMKFPIRISLIYCSKASYLWALYIGHLHIKSYISNLMWHIINVCNQWVRRISVPCPIPDEHCVQGTPVVIGISGISFTHSNSLTHITPILLTNLRRSRLKWLRYRLSEHLQSVFVLVLQNTQCMMPLNHDAALIHCNACRRKISIKVIWFFIHKE